MTELTKKAYAKINLTLEILKKRPDGFHDIRSVMHKIALYDEIQVAVFDGEGISLTCDKHLCSERENLAYRAAESYLKRYCKKTGETKSVQITLKKYIPSQAGLGGGSADGAAVLDALFELLGGLTAAETETIATDLGSDMPFCLERYTCALASGTGTTLAPLPPLKQGFAVVALPTDRMPTAKIYKRYDELYPDTPEKMNSIYLADALRNQTPLREFTALAVNDFEPICFSLSPAIRSLKDEMAKKGALVSQMSGSGAAVFGLFESESKATECAHYLELQNFEEISVNNLNIFPV